MPEPESALVELPLVADPLMDASYNLGAADMRERLAEWCALHDRATQIERIEGGLRIQLGPEEPIDGVADLVHRESRCCGFYAFSLRVRGDQRALEATAGPGLDAAVLALVGL